MKIQLNRISFGLPTKAFFIDYTVSQKRQLPVVKEFIIRVLHSVGNSPVSLIQDYFGFTAAETLAVLDDLIEESLIKWSDNEIELTAHALENFEEVEGNMLPRFFEVVDKTDNVFFELSEFRMLPKTVQRSGINSTSISLPLPDECYSKLNDKAMSAFDSNFEHFREVVKGEDIYSEREELYKINHVNGKFDISIPIPVEYYIETDAPDVLQTAYEDSNLDEWDINKSLFNYMDAAISTKPYSDVTRDFSDYISATDDPILTQYWDDKTNSINIELLLKHYADGTAHHSKDTQLIVGNLYSDFNSQAMTEKLKEIFSKKPKSSGLIWLSKGDNSTWGRTSEFGVSLESITSLFDNRKKTSKAVLALPCSSVSEAIEQRKVYKNRDIDPALIGCEKQFGGENCEVLLLPNIMVACLLHLPITDERNISLPVGYVSFAPELIESVTSNIIRWTSSENNLNDFFERKDTKQEETVLYKYFSQILAQG